MSRGTSAIRDTRKGVRWRRGEKKKGILYERMIRGTNDKRKEIEGERKSEESISKS